MKKTINSENYLNTNQSSWKQKLLPIWVGQLFSLFGSGIVQFALVWHLTETTGSKLVLSLSTLMALLPGILLGPFLGSFVDKYNRKTLIILSDLFSALFIIALSVMFFFKLYIVPVILAIIFLRSICQRVQMIALDAVIPLLVPEESLDNAAGINQTINGIIQLVSIPAGALFIKLLPMFTVLLIDSVTAFIGIVLMMLVYIPNQEKISNNSSKKIIDETLDNFKMLFSYKEIFKIGLISALVNLVFVPSSTFLPLIVTDNMGGDSGTLAILQTSVGVGIIIGGVLMSSWGGFKYRVKTLTLALGLLSISMLVSGLVVIFNHPYFLIATIIFIGVSISVTNASIQAILQSKVPNKELGRINGTIGSMAMLMIPLGLLIATPISIYLGIPGWFLLAGMTTLIVVIVTSLNSKLMKYAIKQEASYEEEELEKIDA